MHTDDADWSFLAYALSDAASGIAERWNGAADRVGDGKRATRHAKLVTRLTRDLNALAQVLADDRFAGSAKLADVALADALAGPLAALGEDLRVGFRDTDRDRFPEFDD